MKGGIPVCVFDKQLQMFRIIYTKGKAVSSFGVSWTTSIQVQVQDPVTMAEDTAMKDAPTDISSNINSNNNNSNNSNNNNIKKKTLTAEYLFIEEVLFLHERGLLQVYQNNNDEQQQQQNQQQNQNHPQQQQEQQILNTQDLYEIMLHQLHIPLQVYLTYSYLRSQTYIVLRHTIDRLSIIKSLMVHNSNSDGNSNDNSNNKGGAGVGVDVDVDVDGQKERKTRKRSHKDQLKQLRLDLRNDTFHAPIPFVFGTTNDTTTTTTTTATTLEAPNVNMEKNTETKTKTKITPTNNIKKNSSREIAFDVYKPNSNYKKSNPGIPDFYVAIANYAQPSPPFVKIKELIEVCYDDDSTNDGNDGNEGQSQGQSQGNNRRGNSIPIRMAVVADGGTVLMFGLTDYGVPSLNSD
jgi:hypothetical protein